MIPTSKSPTKFLSQASALALLLLASASLYAQQPVSITLKGDSEVPPITTSATGTGQITVRTDRTVSGNIKTSGMVTTVAHIHEAAAVGKNGPPIIPLSKTADDSFVVPADARLTEAQYTSYMAGNLYVNVHSNKYPDGEIRAQLPAKPVRIAN